MLQILVALYLAFALYGCGADDNGQSQAMVGSEAQAGTDAEETQEAQATIDSEEAPEAQARIDSEEAAEAQADSQEGQGTGTDAGQATKSKATSAASASYDVRTQAGDALSLEDIPAYSGTAYVTINGGEPAFSADDRKLTDAFEFYSELDSLGRCGPGYANVCPEIMPTEERGSIGQVRPSGWHTVKYNDLIDGNYLYNRCHLIAYQLAGENANEQNLITGTRYLNVEGMLPFEDQVADYVKRTGNHVLYRVTPIFEGQNLVASGVEMEAWSVEDNGEGVCFHVYCYNVQPGISIDYATGDSQEIGDSVRDGEDAKQGAQAAAQPATETGAQNVSKQNAKASAAGALPGEEDVAEYILNTNTKKFHRPECSSVESMKEENKEVTNASIRALKDQGYAPCGNCLASYR